MPKIWLGVIPIRRFTERKAIARPNRVAVRSEVLKESRGGGETRFGCHWLCQCSLRDVDKRFGTGRASGTQNETDNLFVFKSLVAFRSREKTLVRGANNDYPHNIRRLTQPRRIVSQSARRGQRRSSQTRNFPPALRITSCFPARMARTALRAT